MTAQQLGMAGATGPLTPPKASRYACKWMQMALLGSRWGYYNIFDKLRAIYWRLSVWTTPSRLSCRGNQLQREYRPIGLDPAPAPAPAPAPSPAFEASSPVQGVIDS